jgi:hypothetical protein
VDFLAAETQRTQRKDTCFAIERLEKEKINRYAIFRGSKCPQGVLFIVFRPLNGKQ